MPADRAALVSDVVLYNLKVWLAGLAVTVFVPLSLAALVLDVVRGATEPPESLSRRVLALSARFEAWVDVHGDLTDVRTTDAVAAA